ncbi:MAG: GntR family transcriptional regulator [Lachnospiraceae bacterium]|nr:GntR family transcriptional regulator [Lachnospiraceae bacterium]
MQIIISNSSDLPIYEQITEQIKSMILKGELKEGDALPSMRTLAKDLKISVITTKRAYEELESSGFIKSYTGKGSFVSPKNVDLIREENLKKIEASLTSAIELANTTGISNQELKEIFNLLLSEI